VLWRGGSVSVSLRDPQTGQRWKTQQKAEISSRAVILVKQEKQTIPNIMIFMGN
jgi:hypothetical protein